MDISDFLTDEELVQTKTLVGEELLRQRRFKAEDSFKGNHFSVCPIPSSIRYDREDRKAFPDFLVDFLNEMHCVDFDKMLPESRRLLWYCTLLAHELSKSDFPYPEKLDKLDRPKAPAANGERGPLTVFPERIFFGRDSSGIPLVAALFLSFISFFIGYALALPSHHHVAASSFRESPSAPSGGAYPPKLQKSGPDDIYKVPGRVSPQATPERDLSPNPFLPPPRWVVPGTPGHP